VRAPLFVIGFLSLLSLSATGQYEIVEIERPQSAKLVGGIVTDPSGAALLDVMLRSALKIGKPCSVLRKLTRTADLSFQPLRIKLFTTPTIPTQRLRPLNRLGKRFRTIASSGVGFVYEFKDLKLGRQVALKLFPVVG
jgi:hypothetical protein